ncbi:MAG: hypothetical protein AAFN74_02800 [Myxococcota bacterium]
MTNVYQRDRWRFRVLVGAYVISSVGAMVAVLLAWLALARPRPVVVIDQQKRARLVQDTTRPRITQNYVTTFAHRFTKLVAVQDGLAAESQRERALRMMSVPLADYERSRPRVVAFENRLKSLEEDEVSGHLIALNIDCKMVVTDHWACLIRGESGYRRGPSGPLQVRPFVLQMDVEALRVTARSPYGLLVNAFKVTYEAPKQAPGEQG